MNAYSVAAELLGDVELSAGQLSQLRAIDYRYHLEIHRRLHERARIGRRAPSDPSPELGPEDIAVLRDMLVAAIHELLTPAQRARLAGG
jgi:hypothetical protein